MEERLETRIPLIGDKAPSFKAVTTQGEINFPEDYKGKWVILFSHPADFTPVCTTEFITFGAMMDEFKKLNTELVGVSIDSLHSHIAWLRAAGQIEWKNYKNVEIKFPLIDDVKMEVSKKYGMLQPGFSDTQAVRAVFIICLLYTSDAADDLLCVDLGGRRIIKKKKSDNARHIHTTETKQTKI